MPVVLRFSGSYNLAARVVKSLTWSWCSCVETLITNNDGVHLYGVRPLSGVGYRSLDATSGQHVEQYQINISDRVAAAVYQHLLGQFSKPYDYTACLAMALRREWVTDESRWDCSELVAWAFLNAGFPLIRLEHLNHVVPRDLLLSPYLERIS